jgi:hypothetical protein
MGNWRDAKPQHILKYPKYILNTSKIATKKQFKFIRVFVFCGWFY